MQKKTNGWDEYKRLFISELEENRNFRKEMREFKQELTKDVSGLKVKAAIAGGVAGLIGTGLVSMALSAFK